MLHKQIPPVSYFENFKKIIRNEDMVAAKLLIQEAKIKNYDLNRHDEKTKYTLFHFVISRIIERNENDMLTILKLLKESECDLNQSALDSFRNTPIHTASRRALPKIVSWLLQNGAHADISDNTGQTPIDYVDKQLNCNKSHMTDVHKVKLITVREILSDFLKENAIKKENHQVQIKSICRFGLFAVAITTAIVVRQVYPNIMNN